MFTTTTSIKNLTHTKKSLCSRFSLLVWNLHKENQTKAFEQKFHTLLQSYPTDILLLQEVKYPKNSAFIFHKHSYCLTANIETKKHCYGVCTAATSAFDELYSSRTLKKELGFATQKSLQITKHPLCHNKILYIANLHAINFVSHKSFEAELQRVQKVLQKLEGPLIIAGDFNSWSKKRLQCLQIVQKELKLQRVKPDNSHNVKRIFSQEIDHIYYRGLQLLQATAIDTQKISDHNPLYAEFELVL
jgi:endonuclease/exonuclease/phosphatase (EEP) superfamily protein YafD